MEASNNPDQERQDAPENNANNTASNAANNKASTPTNAGNRQIKRSMQKRKRSKKRKTPKRRMRKRNVVVLWLVAIGLLVSMVISFTPTLGNFTGSQIAENPAFFVNDQAITELQVAQARSNPLFGAVTEGEVAEDLELLLVAQLIDNTVLQQAAADTSVSRAEVREAVEEYRVARGVSGRGNDSAYLQLINNQGFTDETFRDFQREQIRQRKFIESLTEGVTVSDSEVEDFYTANQVDYVSDPQIVARQIVVEDEDLASSLHARGLRGEDFAVLASENSIELADVSGAVQADEDGNPQPISRAALPTSVASAAFGLQGQGITDVVSTGGLFYIVQVVDYLPADVQPFDEVAEQVREDALAAKESALLQQTLRDLRQEASLEFPEDSEYDFDNEVVATVGEDEVQALELAEATYLNQQVQQFLSPQNAEIVASFFKPSSLEQLIEQKLALQGADTLDATFVGSEGVVARSALNFIANDAEVTEEDLQAYYEANQANFTIPASATAVQLDFDSEDAAMDFRNVILEESLDFDTLAERAGNEALVYTDLGTVEPGQLDSEIDRYLFGTEAFTSIADDSLLEVSDVIIIENTIEDADTGDAEETVALEADTADTAEAADAGDATGDEAAGNEAAGEDAVTEETPSDEAETTESTEEAATSDTETADAADTDAETTDAETADAETTDAADTDAVDTDTVGAEASETADTDADAETAVEDTSEAVTETTYTLLVTIRTPERVRSLDEVRAQVRQTVLNTERSELQQAWLTALRESIPVENLIAAEPATVPATEPNVEFTTEPAPDATEDTTAEDAPVPEDTEDTSGDAVSDDAANTEGTDAEDGATDGADDAEDTGSEDTGSEDTDSEDTDDVEAAPDASEDGDTSSEDAEPANPTDAEPADSSDTGDNADDTGDTDAESTATDTEASDTEDTAEPTADTPADDASDTRDDGSTDADDAGDTPVDADAATDENDADESSSEETDTP